MVRGYQTAQAAHIWYQNVRFNPLKKSCDKIWGFYSAVIEIKRLIETNRTRINAAHVIVEIITG